MVYEEVNPEMWIPENDGDVIEGVLINIQVDVGSNKSKLYGIEIEPGKMQNVWGSAILDQRMALIKEGSKIKITYKGLGEKKGSNNAPKIFKVEIDRE